MDTVVLAFENPENHSEIGTTAIEARIVATEKTRRVGALSQHTSRPGKEEADCAVLVDRERAAAKSGPASSSEASEKEGCHCGWASVRCKSNRCILHQ